MSNCRPNLSEDYGSYNSDELYSSNESQGSDEILEEYLSIIF